MTPKQPSGHKYAPRTVRFSDEDWQRVRDIAKAEHLDPSVWLRKIVLDHLDAR
jgi:hypothetical protein